MRSRSTTWHLAVGAVLGLVTLFSQGSPAQAAGKGGRVGVVVMRGAGEGPIRAKVTSAIKANGFQVVGGQQLDSTASSLGVSLDSEAGFKAVARELNISAFVTGEISRKKADITVHNGADGSALGDASFAGANPKKIAAQVGADFWRQLGPAVRQGKAPSGAKTKSAIAEEAPPPEEEEAAAEPPPEPKKKARRVEKREEESAEASPSKSEEATESKPAKREKAEKEEASEEEESATSYSGAGPALVFGVGAGALFRRLEWHQAVMNNLPPYSLSPGPEGAVWAEAYPAAFSSKGIVANLGLVVNFNQGFGVTSTTTDGGRLTTKFQDLAVGARVRHPFTDTVSARATVSFVEQLFKLQSSTGAASAVPSVAYTAIRAGLGLRLALTPVLSAELDAAYLLGLGVGKLNGEIAAMDKFPRATAGALDVGLSVGYRLIRLVGLRVGLDFRQYGLDLKVRQGDPIIAGGATDRYITVWGGVELIFDGLSGGAAADNDDEKEPEAAAPPAKKKKKAAAAEEESEEK